MCSHRGAVAPGCPSTPRGHAGGAPQLERLGLTRAKTPVPRPIGDRALSYSVLRELTARGNGYQWGRPCPQCCNALVSSCLPFLAGPTRISPGQSPSVRSQDGPSCRHRISASFRNPLGSLTISVRSIHRDFQRTNCPSCRCEADGNERFVGAGGQGGAATQLALPRPSTNDHPRIGSGSISSAVSVPSGSAPFHIAIGRRWKGTKIRLYVAGLNVRIVTFDGKLLRQLILDTSRTYQPSGLPRYRVREGSDVPR